MGDRVTQSGQISMGNYYLNKVKENLAIAREQAASGRKGNTYAALGLDAAPQIREEALLNQTTEYIKNNQYVDQRLERTEIAVSKLLDVANKCNRMIIEVRSGAANSINIPLILEKMLDEAVSLLNVQDADGRYIFSGSQTNIPPVNLALMPTVLTTGALPDTSYYQGDTKILTLKASDTLTIKYGILAQNPAFEALIHSLKLATTTSYSLPIDQVRVNDCLTNLNASVNKMSDLIAEIGSNRRQIIDTNTHHENYQQYVNNIMEGRVNADPAEVLTKVARLSDQVNTNYFLLQKIPSMSLVNYLR